MTVAGVVRDGAALERYGTRTRGWLTGLALLFLVVFALPVLWTGAPRRVRNACDALNLAVWVVFVFDYLVRVTLAPQRRRYITRHIIDLLVVALPMLRPLRVLRVFSVTEALVTRSPRALFAQAVQFIAAAAALIVFVGSVAVLDAERHSPVANIKTFPDALWWAASTITTVGYGDRYPTTGTGRLVAAAMMLVGISLAGVITATVAAWFVRQTQAVERELAAETGTDLAQVLARLDALEARLADRLDAGISRSHTGEAGSS